MVTVVSNHASNRAASKNCPFARVLAIGIADTLRSRTHLGGFLRSLPVEKEQGDGSAKCARSTIFQKAICVVLQQKEVEDLMRQHGPGRESILILRAQHTRDWFAYFWSVGQVVIAVLAVITCVLSILAICFSDVLPKMGKAVEQSWPQFLMQFLGQTPDASHVRQVLLLDVFFLLLVMTGGAYLLAKRAIKELHGLLSSAHRQQPRSASFPVREYIRVFSAPWLYPQVIEAPSPTTVLDVLQDHQSTSEAWIRELEAYIEERQQESPPALSMLLSISDSVTISLVGQDGKRETISFTHPQQAALIAYFAMQPRGAWIPRGKVIKQVYGAKGAHLFALHVSRIHAAINQVAKDAGFLSREAGDTGQSSEKLKLFEFDDSEQVHEWRRVVSCEVEVFGDLNAFYERLKAAEDTHTLVGQEETRRGCHQVMQTYGRGYLAEHQAPKSIWLWARDEYIAYRDKCLFILRYAAEREWEAAHTQQGDERYEAIRQSALFYGWFALVANGIVPILHIEEAEEALCTSLKRYNMIRDVAAARAAFQAYAQQAKSKDDRWKPKLKITEIWPEATSED